MYLLLDVETSDKPDFNKPADADGQPRVASVGMIAIDTAGEGYAIVDQRYYEFKPCGWEMSPGATEMNGLTTEHLLEVGVPVGPSLDQYSMYIREGRIVIAYNSRFDIKMMRAELRHAGMDDLFMQTLSTCAMLSMSPVYQAAKGTGGSFKWPPKLEVALSHFGIPYEDGHNALADCQSVLLLIRAMKAAGFDLREPKVHRAREGSPARKRS